MKVFVFVTILAAAYAKPSGILAPITYSIPIAAPISISSQYHAQDTLGQYNYGYANGLSSKAEVKSIDGITRGGYSYIDAEGKLQSVQYTSDALNGFRVAATNLPVAPAPPKVEPLPQPAPVEDTPEVAAAKSKHLAALEEAKARAAEPVVVAAAPAPIVASAPIISSGFQTYSYGINSPLISTYAYPAISTYSAPWVSAPFIVNSLPAVPSDTPEVAKAKAEHLAAVEEVKSRN